MDIEILIVILSCIICFIELYSEYHIKNYGTFLQRTLYLFSIKTLFILFKLSCAFVFTYILFDLKDFYNLEKQIKISLVEIDFSKWYLYFSAPLSFALITILSNSKNIHLHLRGFNVDNERLNHLLANLKYFTVRLTSFILSFLIFRIVYVYMIKLHEYFIKQGLYIFDWLVFDTEKIDNYNKGVYISLTLTIVIFFLFNNAFIKKNSNNWHFREIDFNYFKYLFITLLLGLGTFFGFFSFFNGLHNLLNRGISDWITKENLLGILPIRISSILLLYYLLIYVYNTVLSKRLSRFILLGVFPFRQIPDYTLPISFSNRETLFFTQISFYVINIALSEFFVIIGFKNIYLSILNFAILFILDDFKIINDYSNGLQRVMKWHYIRICFFNFIMLIVSILLLSSKEYYLILLLYLVIFIILARYYLKNVVSIYIKPNNHLY